MNLLLASILLFTSVYAATTEDYRSLYDHLLLEVINEKLRSATVNFTRISDEVNKFLSTKENVLRKTIVKEIDIILPVLKDADRLLQTELNKTGLNTIEEFTLQKAEDETHLLIHHFTLLEDTVKSHTPDEQIIGDLDEELKIRNTEAEKILKKIHDYNQNPSVSVKTEINTKIDAELPVLEKFSDEIEVEYIKHIGHGRDEQLRLEKMLILVKRIETTLIEGKAKLNA